MDAYSMLLDFPKQFDKKQTKEFDIRNYKGVVFSGMGGSGIVGDLAKLLLEASNTPIPVISLRGYSLPSYVSRDWLVVCTSYSGDTEETVSILENAIAVDACVVCISSGGTLKKLAEDKNIDYYNIPQGYPPRYALGYMLSTIMSLFGLDPIPIQVSLSENLPEIMSLAEKYAKLTFGYLPIVYATPLTEAAAFRWKTQINENSKTQCYYATLPEMHHNEVVGLSNPTIRNLCYFFLLYDTEDHPRVLKRVSITEKVLKDLGISPISINGKGRTLIERVMYLIYLGDWISYYLAQAYSYDPIPVDIIQSIKKELSDKT